MEEKKYTIPIHNTTKILYGNTKDFFRLFFMFISPFHNLTTQELFVVAELYRRKYELSKVILDGELLDSFVLNAENKKIIMEESGIPQMSQLHVVLSRLKGIGIIQNGRINPKLMPAFSEDLKAFNMVFSFQFKEGHINTSTINSVNRKRRASNKKVRDEREKGDDRESSQEVIPS